MTSLWPHQKKTLTFFKDKPVGFDFSSPGTGKTRVQIEMYLARKTRGKLLIVCPKTLMHSAWGVDIERFAPKLTYALAYAEHRREAFDLNTDAVVINTDGVKWLAEKANAKRLDGFDHLIIDEASVFKSPTAQRTKAMMALAKRFTHRYLLTGTPTPNSVTELWAPALIVDGGKRLGSSYYGFRNAMQSPTQVGPSARHVRWDDKPGATQAVEELLGDVTVRHAFEDVMTHVPANHRDTKLFALNRKTKALYDKLQNDCILAVKNDTITAVHAAALRQKLLQCASGAVYNEAGAYTLLDTQRYELIADLIEERKHSIVFFNWRHQRDELTNAFDRRGWSFAVIDGNTPQRDHDRLVKDYQQGAYKTLLLHPRTGAHGLTLTRGTTTIISSPFYEADLLQQAIHRIHRGGQTQATETILVCAADTVEGAVYERLNDKEVRMMDLLTLIETRRAA